MTGLDVRSALLARHPRVEFLLTSAYSRTALSPEGLPESVDFLPKPYSAHELLTKVRAVLNGRRAAP